MASQTIITRVTGFLAQIAIAKLLVPDQVGLIALVTSITIISRHLLNPGIDEILLTKKGRINRWLSAAFWFNLAMGVLGAAVLGCTAAIVVRVAQHYGNTAFGDPMVLKMSLIMAIASPIAAISWIPFTVLQSQLRFKEISVIMILESIGLHALTIVLALLGYGAYSFVIPMPVIALLRFVALMILAKPTIHMRLSIHRWPALSGSTGWLLGQRILRTGRDQGDQVVLGALFSDTRMNGYYWFAVLLSSQVVRLMCDNLLKVLLPVMNTIRDDIERLEGATIRACRVLAAVIIPLLMCQIVLCGPIIRLLFGVIWSPAIPLVQWLSLAPLLYASTYPMNAMISAMGRFRVAFWLALVNLVLFFAVVTPLAIVGRDQGAAIGVAIWSWLSALMTGIVAFRSARGAKIVLAVVVRSLMAVALASIPATLMVLIIPIGPTYAVVKIGIGIPMLLVLYYYIMRRLDPEAMELLHVRFGAKLQAILAGRRNGRVVEPPELAGASQLLE